MAGLDVHSGGRKEDQFQGSLAIQQNSVSKTSKQPARSSEKLGGVEGRERLVNGQQCCGAPSSAGTGRPHGGHAAAGTA